MEPTYNGFKQDSGAGNKTPPPAYTPNFTGPSSLPSGGQAQPGAGFDPHNPYSPYNSVNYNPWAAVPTATHPNPALNSGPTPTSALQIPYAYYDPRSAHSLAEADSRAKAQILEYTDFCSIDMGVVWIYLKDGTDFGVVLAGFEPNCFFLHSLNFTSRTSPRWD
ncbi:hypothetical protein BDP27DRAFT_296583 [Rhodocollybia butyracea]|uniref:Uncharacterized protein n=1 Tax=Rhodocollybia butyracea TaxID=206335 RepID=A0A9P5PGG1_9AGAR|nr:hypothetical protein BDP27DRAFT_296583 [Rhodocollybia butyracea]